MKVWSASPLMAPTPTGRSVAMQGLGSGTAHRGASPAAVAGKPRVNNVVVNWLMAAILAAILFGASGSPSLAQSGSFAGMGGTWHGGGTVSLDDGSTERIRCRATYEVAGPRMGMVLTCASDAYRFNLQGDVVSDGRQISGSWSESTRN